MFYILTQHGLMLVQSLLQTASHEVGGEMLNT